MRIKSLLALTILSAIALAGVAVLVLSIEEDQVARVLPSEDAPPVRGWLRLSAFGTTSSAQEPTLHRSIFVKGPDYSGMEDNDLRGHLDGTFIWGWNQKGQTHVRAGRIESNARYGEYELFRFLQRWADIELPPLTRIAQAQLELHLEDGPEFPVRVLLYEVKQDWNPGEGGTLKDNVSPPAPGEVWWNERAHDMKPWGLPGVGYASDMDPYADTMESPLAGTLYQPGDSTIRFSSRALAAYIEDRLEDEEPLLFLVKLNDYHEDVSGSAIVVSSGDYGDSRNVVRRPHLTLLWKSHSEVASAEHRVFVEQGRVFVLPYFHTQGGSFVAATFTDEAGGTYPTVQILDATIGGAPEWRRLSRVLRCECDSIRTRVVAAEDPVRLGEPFVAELVNTWVRSAPPEEQRVPWIFWSPTGVVHELEAEYQGEYRWIARFRPNELGIWRYQWSYHFDQPTEGPIGRFDVVIGTRSALEDQLRLLLEDVQDVDFRAKRSLWEKLARRFQKLRYTLSREPPGHSEAEAREQLMTRFARLERGALQLEDPDSFAQFRETDIYRIMNEIRGEMGKPAPDSIPLVPGYPPRYRRK
ncbi:MAG: hypothetical protein P8X82_06790 [Gemmatimonadales bacterium]